MRICVLSMEYPPYPSYISPGGVGTHTYYLSRFLARRGHEVHVIAVDEHQSSKVVDGVYVHRVTSPHFRPLHVPLYSLRATRLRQILSNSKDFDIVHNQSPYGFFESYIRLFKRSVPLVTTIHGVPIRELIELQTIKNTGINDVIYKLSIISGSLFLDAIEYRTSTKIIAVCEHVKNDLVKFHGVPQEKISVVYNGVDAERFAPNVSGEKIREQFRLGTSRVVLFSGRLIRRKNPDLFVKSAIKVVEKLPDVKFMIVGSGYMERELRNIAKGLKDQIIFGGYVPHESMPYYYAAADVVCLPSVYETGPLALLEPMSMGKPVISSSGMEFFNDETVLIRKNDVNSISEKITYLLQDESRRRRLGCKLRSKVLAEFTWEKVAERTEHVYEEAVNRG